MKIDINYSEEKESHVGIYSLTSKMLESDSSLLHVLFPDENDSRAGMVVNTQNTKWNVGEVSLDFISCNSSYWTKLNADSITFNLKD